MKANKKLRDEKKSKEKNIKQNHPMFQWQDHGTIPIHVVDRPSSC